MPVEHLSLTVVHCRHGTLRAAYLIPLSLQVGVTAMLIASKYEEIWAPEVGLAVLCHAASMLSMSVHPHIQSNSRLAHALLSTHVVHTALCNVCHVLSATMPLSQLLCWFIFNTTYLEASHRARTMCSAAGAGLRVHLGPGVHEGADPGHGEDHAQHAQVQPDGADVAQLPDPLPQGERSALC